MNDFEREVIERLAGIESQIKTVREDLKEDYKVLHGNGTPGLIHRVTVLEAHQKEKDNHHGVLLAVVGFLVNAAIAIYAAIKN